MSIFDKLNSSFKLVLENNNLVTIDYKKVDELINTFDSNSITYWLDSNPFNILNMNVESIINFLLIYHTIGDYCFFGNPKWEIDTVNGKMDGSFAIMYLIIERFKINNDFNMSFSEFSDLLKGNVEIPLLKNRYDNLVIMNDFIRKNGSFYDLIKNYNSDIELFSFIINNFSYFKDVSIFHDNEILYYKRAQLLVSDILHVLKSKTGIDVDYSHLIGCADYKIPQVLRCYGCIKFSKELEDKVDNMILIDENSIEELSIRSATLEVINYIYLKLNKKFYRMDINDYLWLLSQDKVMMNKPYHRTITNHY